MFITPISPISSIGELSKIQNVAPVENNSGESFTDIFKSVLNDAKSAEADYAEKQYLLATGQIDDAHDVPIAGTAAQLSVDLLVQIRNKALDAYNEVMRIGV